MIIKKKPKLREVWWYHGYRRVQINAACSKEPGKMEMDRAELPWYNTDLCAVQGEFNPRCSARKEFSRFTKTQAEMLRVEYI